MARVARGREGREPECLGADRVDVRLRHRLQLAPERVELVAVEPTGARLQARRVDEVWRADLGHVHLKLRVLADQNPRRARVVEMDVREEKVTNVSELEPALGKP